MESFTCVVDGQQRLNAIREYVADGFAVRGRKFSALSTEEKTGFIKYEVPVIDFDLDAGDERLKGVFKRLNRTYYSLSTIERIATEYSSSEFLLCARVLCGDISSSGSAEEEVELADDAKDSTEGAEDETGGVAYANAFLRDPGISDEKWNWLQERANGEFASLLSAKNIFSAYEFQRKVPLMFVLNVMATMLGGYYSRNAKVKDYLEDYNSEFDQSQGVIDKLNNIASIVNQIDLDQKSIWRNKSNFFSLICEMSFLEDIDTLNIKETAIRLSEFEKAVPREFSIAAREAVNNKPERTLRGAYARDLFVLTP